MQRPVPYDTQPSVESSRLPGIDRCHIPRSGVNVDDVVGTGSADMEHGVCSGRDAGAGPRVVQAAPAGGVEDRTERR
jgi:hypothetical protein